MGHEIKQSQFTQADFDQFYRNLREETHLLEVWFDAGIFKNERFSAGFELEVCLVDPDFRPAPINEAFLKKLNDPLVVPELSKFNVEINSTPQILTGPALHSLEQELVRTWGKCHRCAKELDSEVLMIGILPSLTPQMLNTRNMSAMQRYKALNDQIFALRQGKAMMVDIRGKDHLIMSHEDVMFESAATSMQIHTEADQDHAARLYNTSLILSAPMVAVAANSPFLFGKDLWDETRIPLFEQSVALGTVQGEKTEELRRVTFGSGYLKDSLYECFLENLVTYPVLLPSLFEEDPAQMNHLKLHNGTIWRWNRPLIGLGMDGRVHLRIEHRVMPAGPTPTDIIANIAFYLGLIHHYTMQPTALETSLDFNEARNNFYEAARQGLDTEIRWIGGRKVTLHTLLLEHLLPDAIKGLTHLGLDKSDIDYHLGDIIRNRILTKQNGARWQRQFIDKRPNDFEGLTAAYIERQQQGRPVHLWSL